MRQPVISYCAFVDTKFLFSSTFGPDKLSPMEVQRMYAEARMLEEEHSHEFTGS